jgi:hypothetical protein
VRLPFRHTGNLEFKAVLQVPKIALDFATLIVTMGTHESN